MPGKHHAKVCAQCGKEETTGWSLHWQRKHSEHNKQELILITQPLSPWAINWFDFLSPEMQEKYKDSNPAKVGDAIVYTDDLMRQTARQKSTIGILPNERPQQDVDLLPLDNNQFQETNSHSQPTFSTNYLTDWERLSRTCSSMSQMSEAAKLLIEEKNKQLLEKDQIIFEAKKKIAKLEEKLEMKEDELMRTNVDLGEANATLRERDKQLAEIKEQLKEWTETANKLINGRADFDEWKKRFKQMSATSSIEPSSQQQSYIHSQENHSDQEMEDQKVYDRTLFGFENLGLTCYAGAALQFLQAISIQLTGKLAVQQFLTKQSLRHFYEVNLKLSNIFEQNDSVEALLQFMEIYIQDQLNHIWIEQSRDIKCRQCNIITRKHEKSLMLQLPCTQSNLISCLSTYLKKESLVQHNQYECSKCCVKTNADTQMSIEQINSILLIQLNRFSNGGRTTKKDNNLVEMPLKVVLNNQQYELLAFVAHFSYEANEGHYIAYSNYNGIWNEFNDNKVAIAVDISKVKDKAYYYCYRRLTQQQLGNISLPENIPTIDIYQRGKLLGKRLCSKILNQKRDEAAAKRLRGEQLTLHEKRANESDVVKAVLKRYENKMLHVKDWLQESFGEKVSKEKFKKIDDMFCDGLLLPRLRELFGDYKQYEIYLRSKGLQVQKISPGSVEGFVYVRLEDSANAFTLDLSMKLNELIIDMQELARDKINIADIYI